MTPQDRAHLLQLLREAMALLDEAGEIRASPHLQLVLDLLDDQAPYLTSPTCH